MRFARALGPSVAVRVERHTFDPQSFAPLAEFRGPVFAIDRPQVRKKRPGLGQRTQNWRTPLPEFYQWRFDIGFIQPGELFPVVANGPIAPVDILPFQTGNIALSSAEFPKKLAKLTTLLIAFSSHDLQMLLVFDCALALVFHPM
jgi:hypothetical protein